MKKIFYCPSCMEGQISSAAFCPVCKNPLNIENAEHQLPAGTLLKDRYLVGKVLGEGGFGITYIGRDLTLDVKVAIKEYYPSAVANRYHTKSLDVSVSQKEQSVFFEQGKDKFLTEARTLAKFPDESNIVGVRDFFQDNNTAYIIMEFLEGISLAQHLREQGQLPFDELYALLEPVMDALEKVHGQGLIHRDISPANLMLLKSGSVKLLDFGTARAVDYSGEKSLSVILKPGYAPEEQYRSHGAQGPWTDVYALCATIYKLITGATPENAMNRLYEDTLVHPSALGADISPAQETVLMRGLAIRQNDRIQSMHELKREFLAASAQQETSVPEDDDERTLFAPKKNAAVTPKSTADRQQEPSRLSEDKSLSGKMSSYTPSADTPSADISSANTSSADMSSADISSADAAPSQKTAHRIHRKKETPPEKPASRRKDKRHGKQRFLYLLPAVPIILLLLWIFAGGTESKYKNGSGAYINDETITGSMLRQIAKDKDIDYLSLNGCEISDEMIRKISKMKYITDIRLSDCTGFTSLDALASMKALDTLSYSHNDSETEDGLDGAALFSAEFSGLETLSISGWTLTSGCDFLKSFPNVSYLSLLNMDGIGALSALAALPELKSLRLSSSDLGTADLSALNACEKLENLEAEECSLSSIAWMEGMTGLKWVYLSGNEIQTLEPLKSSTSLFTLDAQNNRLQNLSGLEEHFALSYLYLSGNELNDISALESCTGLFTLYLNDNRLTDVSALGNLNSLVAINLSDNQLVDVSALTACEAITHLYMNNNQIESLSLCEQMIDLTSLEAMNNQLTDLSGLENVTQLKNVRLSGNQITDISLLSKSISHLEIVMLSNNRISDLSPLNGCSSLYSLTISNNELTTLDDLSGCTSLYYLSAHGNQINDISGLSSCRSLYYIDLGENEISDLSPLASTGVSRWILLLQNNQISDISCLPKSVQYVGLSLYNNPITDFSAIGGMYASNGVLYVSWASGWDYSAIAGSTFNIRDKNLVDVPLDEQAETDNLEIEVRESFTSYLNFLTLDEADSSINDFRLEYGPDEYTSEAEEG